MRADFLDATMRRRVAALAILLVVSSWTAFGQAPGRWVTNKFAPLPEPEEEYTATVASDRLYLIGGNRSGRPEWPRHVLEYDLAANKWTAKKPAPFPGDHMAATSLGGKIYVFGGQAEGGVNKPLNTSWEYDPSSDAWRSLAPMPTARTAAVAVEAGGRIYVIGGNTVAGLTIGTNDAYDPATNRWESRTPMPTPRNHPAGGAVAGKIYVIGGRLAAPNIGGFLSSNTDVVEEYDPAANAWRPMTKMPTPRSGHGWITHQGRIYVAGGEVRDSHMDAIFRDVEVFDPSINDWYRLPPMPTARHGVNLAAMGNRLHAIGGHLAFAATGERELHTPANEVFEFFQR
jgi:N-acetylneuraminic acid mutarotase